MIKRFYIFLKKLLSFFFKIIYYKWIFLAANIYFIIETIVGSFNLESSDEPITFFEIIILVYFFYGIGKFFYKKTENFQLKIRLIGFFLLSVFLSTIVSAIPVDTVLGNLIGNLITYLILGFTSAFLICLYFFIKINKYFRFNKSDVLMRKIQTPFSAVQNLGKPNYAPKLYFSFDFSLFPPIIKIQTHDKYVEEKTSELNSLNKNQSYKDYITEVFQTIKNCDFVIFQSHKLEFVHYWVGNGGYWLDFPIANYNANGNSLSKLTSLLKKLGFKKKKKEETKLNFFEYHLNKSPEFLLLNANFGRDKNLAINFTCEVLQKIFKVPLKKLEIMIG